MTLGTLNVQAQDTQHIERHGSRAGTRTLTLGLHRVCDLNPHRPHGLAAAPSQPRCWASSSAGPPRQSSTTTRRSRCSECWTSTSFAVGVEEWRARCGDGQPRFGGGTSAETSLLTLCSWWRCSIRARDALHRVHCAARLLGRLPQALFREGRNCHPRVRQVRACSLRQGRGMWQARGPSAS